MSDTFTREQVQDACLREYRRWRDANGDNPQDEAWAMAAAGAAANILARLLFPKEPDHDD